MGDIPGPLISLAMGCALVVLAAAPAGRAGPTMILRADAFGPEGTKVLFPSIGTLRALASNTERPKLCGPSIPVASYEWQDH